MDSQLPAEHDWRKPVVETGQAVSITRDGSRYKLVARALVRAGVDEVFAFFSDAGNLDPLTPPFLRFEILTRMPVEMRVGSLIDYRLRLRGFPIRWRSEITAWDPPYRFVDEQRRGPYRCWIHEHTFEECDGGTAIADRVEYAVPGGRLAHELFVGRDLRNIFGYRHKTLQDRFGCIDEPHAAEVLATLPS